MEEIVQTSYLSTFTTYLSSFVNVFLLLMVGYLVYKIFNIRYNPQPSKPSVPMLPKMKKRDFTLEELRDYDGVNKETDGRILIAVNGKVFDVTKGRVHYGPGGPYSLFAGRDASRGLATFNMSEVKTEYDDLSDLQPHEIDSMKEWEMQFTEKYDFIGRLLKPGELPTTYSDDEEEEKADDPQPETTEVSFKSKEE